MIFPQVTVLIVNRKMNLLITGAGGMLGKALAPCLEGRGHKVRAVAKEEMDVTNFAQVKETLSGTAPDLVLHCAAYTKVDQAGSLEAGLAFLINGLRHGKPGCRRLSAGRCRLCT